jgi:GNAT superfamily N-acetyltransferase
MEIAEAKSKETIEATAALFREYASTLDFDLSFQHFDDEMRMFPVQYSPPSGCLLVAYDDEILAGCVGLRKLDEGVCEMKRLYVRPQFRGRGIGRALVLKVIDMGRRLGYGRMRLDTVPSMHEAIVLYESFGFKQIPQYRENPIVGALFFELQLRESAAAL